MKNAKPFQLIVLVVCVIIALVGVLAFAFGGAKKDPTKDYGPQVVIWGTEDAAPINLAIKSSNDENPSSVNAIYVQKKADTFNQVLLEALAEGDGPDAILLPLEETFLQKGKLIPIPFENMNERSFKDSFIQQAELFKLGEGYLALPFSVDPLVMYWNRDIFTIHNEVNPPSYWDALVALVPKLSEVTEDFKVNKSAVALGDYRNINHSKEIFSTLLFQAGIPITSSGQNNDGEEVLSLSVFSRSSETPASPALSVLNFYTQFQNPLSKQYTWNRSLPNSLDAFVSGDVAMYFGFGSEADTIRAKNPNLNFDMAFFPQPNAGALPATYGKMSGLAILSASSNKSGTWRAITAMTSKDFLARYAELSGLPPVRRDLLVDVPNDDFSPILYKSALYAKSWIQPSIEDTDSALKDMIESALSNQASSDFAVTVWVNRMEASVTKLNIKNNEE